MGSHECNPDDEQAGIVVAVEDVEVECDALLAVRDHRQPLAVLIRDRLRRPSPMLLPHPPPHPASRWLRARHRRPHDLQELLRNSPGEIEGDSVGGEDGVVLGGSDVSRLTSLAMREKARDGSLREMKHWVMEK